MAQDYRELATTLRGRIDAGEFRQTGKLPTEDQLIEEYQTTRYRVRNAIAVLAEAGDVFPVRGSGVFVREDREAITCRSAPRAAFPRSTRIAR